MKNLAFIIVATSLLAACIPDIMNTKPEVRGLAGAAPVQTLTDPVSGTDATLRPDGILRVVLQSNPTTGYYWVADTGDALAIEFVSDDYTADPAPAGVGGSGGVQTLVFKGVKKGKATISLSYQRSDRDVANTKTIRVKVID